MRKLNTAMMRKLLKKGIKRAKLLPKIHSQDYYIPITSQQIKNGWYYQIEKIYKGVIVFAFRPPKTYCAKEAEYYLSNY